MAIGRAIKAVDRNIIYVALLGTADGEGGRASSGCRWRAKASPTGSYDDDGNLASRTIPGTVLKDPAKARRAGAAHGARRRDRVAQRQDASRSRSHTLCVHGDEATGVDVAGAACARALEGAGIQVVPLRQDEARELSVRR